MYLRETRRTNRDGSVVGYLQLAHNQRHPQTGNSVAKVIHNFGRVEHVDRDALARLVSSISRFLTPEQALSAAAGAEVEILDSRHLGGAWRLDRVWERLGIGTAIRRVASVAGWTGWRWSGCCSRWSRSAPWSRAANWPRPTGSLTGSLSRDAPGSPTTPRIGRWTSFSTRWPRSRGEVFASVATLLNLDLDLAFVDSPANRPPEGAIAVLPAMALVARTV
jgi:hypothetical protein